MNNRMKQPSCHSNSDTVDMGRNLLLLLFTAFISLASSFKYSSIKLQVQLRKAPHAPGQLPAVEPELFLHSKTSFIPPAPISDLFLKPDIFCTFLILHLLSALSLRRVEKDMVLSDLLPFLTWMQETLSGLTSCIFSLGCKGLFQDCILNSSEEN